MLKVRLQETLEDRKWFKKRSQRMSQHDSFKYGQQAGGMLTNIVIGALLSAIVFAMVIKNVLGYWPISFSLVIGFVFYWILFFKFVGYKKLIEVIDDIENGK